MSSSCNECYEQLQQLQAQNETLQSQLNEAIEQYTALLEDYEELIEEKDQLQYLLQQLNAAYQATMYKRDLFITSSDPGFASNSEDLFSRTYNPDTIYYGIETNNTIGCTLERSYYYTAINKYGVRINFPSNFSGEIKITIIVRPLLEQGTTPSNIDITGPYCNGNIIEVDELTGAPQPFNNHEKHSYINQWNNNAISVSTIKVTANTGNWVFFHGPQPTTLIKVQSFMWIERYLRPNEDPSIPNIFFNPITQQNISQPNW